MNKQMAAVPGLIFVVALFCGAYWFSGTGQEAPKPQPIAEVVQPRVIVIHAAPEALAAQASTTDHIKKATESVFQIRFNTSNCGGTGWLIGRGRTENGFLYRAVTAKHVMDNEVDTEMFVSFNTWTRGAYEELVEFKILDQNAALDWSIIEFELTRALPCLEIATQQDVNELSPMDDVYIFGSENLAGVVIHRTNIAAMTDEYPTPDVDQPDTRNSLHTFHQFPNLYFRVDRVVIGGASGGPLLTKTGKVLGVMVARWNNCSIALKSPIITTTTNPSFFLVAK